MKKLLFLSLFLIINQLTCFAQIPTNGLLAYYPFCGNTNDASGNGHTLINNNLVPTTDRFGTANAAYQFNSNSIAYTDTCFISTGDFTYSCWALPDTTGNSIIIYNGNAGSSGFGIILSNPPVYSIGQNATILYGGVNHMATSSISLHQWHNLVLRRTSTTVDLIVDTVIIASISQGYYLPNGGFQIGANLNLSHGFTGKIDDISIYNRALTIAELSEIYQDQNLIVSEPVNDTVNANANASFSISLQGTGLIYQWQVSSAGGFINLSNVSPYSGVNTANLVISNVNNAMDSTFYRCVVSNNGCIDDTSISAILRVSSPLAINFVSLSALNQKNRNYLNWSVESESIGDYFIVERSSNGIAFDRIAKIEVKERLKTYSFTDDSPIPGKNFYRLKLADASGSFKYSNTASVYFSASIQQRLSLYPNPAGNDVTVQINGDLGANPQYQIYDYTGKRILSAEISKRETKISTTELLKGIYMLKYSDSKGLVTLQLIKQ